MNDTPQEIATMVRAKLMAHSGAERVLMGSRMFDAARAMVLASFPRAFRNRNQESFMRAALRQGNRD